MKDSRNEKRSVAFMEFFGSDKNNKMGRNLKDMRGGNCLGSRYLPAPKVRIPLDIEDQSKTRTIRARAQNNRLALLILQSMSVVASVILPIQRSGFSAVSIVTSVGIAILVTLLFSILNRFFVDASLLTEDILNGYKEFFLLTVSSIVEDENIVDTTSTFYQIHFEDCNAKYLVPSPKKPEIGANYRVSRLPVSGMILSVDAM